MCHGSFRIRTSEKEAAKPESPWVTYRKGPCSGPPPERICAVGHLVCPGRCQNCGGFEISPYLQAIQLTAFLHTGALIKILFGSTAGEDIPVQLMLLVSSDGYSVMPKRPSSLFSPHIDLLGPPRKKNHLRTVNSSFHPG